MLGDGVSKQTKFFSFSKVTLSVLGGVGLLLLLLSSLVSADPIAPPAGYPKLTLSMKTVSPTLVAPGGITLSYAIAIRNTGAYTAMDVALADVFPTSVTYNGDAGASVMPTPTVSSDTLRWQGDVGFDETVWVTFSVQLTAEFSGTLRNTAVISHVSLSGPLSVTAETVVTNYPIFKIEKSAMPRKPGPNKPLLYTLKVTNWGQTATDLPISVTDYVPSNTTLLHVGLDGTANPDDSMVMWSRNVTLALGASTEFTFSVMVGDVADETPIVNQMYTVESLETPVVAGDVYTVMVVDPDLRLTKSVWPDPPGSNRDAMYTLRVFNAGSLATDLVITDVVPAGVTYASGGTELAGVVSWTLPSLDTGEFALFTYTVYISDVLHIPVVNDMYAVCSGEGVCAPGKPLTIAVEGPIFSVDTQLEPIAKKPGGGNDPAQKVTPTIVIRNLGPGNAIDAYAVLRFENISIGTKDWVDPVIGTLGGRRDCGTARCFDWMGSLGVGEAVTFTVVESLSTIGGEEGNRYTATGIITDMLSGRVTDPVSNTAIGKITHLAYLQPSKSAPAVIGRGQLMTYTLDVINTALATDEPPLPVLYDFLPMSMTVITISHGGQYREITGSMQMRVITWTLPALGTGEALAEPRWFVVRLDSDIVSGTQVVNEYRTMWYENDATYTGWLSATGEPITTTVIDVGLIDSYKEAMPQLLEPGTGNVITYVIHVKNSSALPLMGVTVNDTFPWEYATYQRDAVATVGSIMSDIVSLTWTGNVAPFGEELITLTVMVDDDYEGPVMNTAMITHPDLLVPVEVEAVAYVSTAPVLLISKSATPDPVSTGATLLYTLKVVNAGQLATALVITDVLPSNVTFDAVYDGGVYDETSEQVTWELSDLPAGGGSETFRFQVVVGSGREVVNALYGVSCDEGIVALGEVHTTEIRGGGEAVYLPLVMRNFGP